MKKNLEVCISETLKRVFSILSREPNLLVEHDGFRIVKFKKNKNEDFVIGVGLNFECSIMNIYEVKKDAIYESYDHRQFKKTFEVGCPLDLDHLKCWTLNLEKNKIIVAPENFATIANLFASASEILDMIKILSFAEVHVEELQ